MQVSDLGRRFITREEGVRLIPYRDSAGVWTVGVGHTGADVHPGVRWTFHAVQAIFASDLERHTTPLRAYGWLEQHQFDALASFIFNVGAPAFAMATFRSYMAPGEPLHPSFNDWNKITVDGNKVVAPVLAARRERERVLYETGDYGKI